MSDRRHAFKRPEHPQVSILYPCLVPKINVPIIVMVPFEHWTDPFVHPPEHEINSLCSHQILGRGPPGAYCLSLFKICWRGPTKQTIKSPGENRQGHAQVPLTRCRYSGKAKSRQSRRPKKGSGPRQTKSSWRPKRGSGPVQAISPVEATEDRFESSTHNINYLELLYPSAR